MKSLLHRLAHLFNMYYGKVVTRLDGDKIIVGFRCDTCGTVDGEHEARLPQMVFGPDK